jgi:hypothetical protein
LDDQAAAAETTASPFSEENREATQASQLQNIKCDRPVQQQQALRQTDRRRTVGKKRSNLIV